MRRLVTVGKCIVCEADITGVRKTLKYCGATCRKRAERERKKNAKVNVPAVTEVPKEVQLETQSEG